MNKAPIIGYDQINYTLDAFNPAIRDHDGITLAIEIANYQRDADHKHYQGIIREIRFQILEWFRNYAHQLDRKFPHPTTEEQGWLGNIWDMIHMAGKENFESKYQEEK